MPQVQLAQGDSISFLRSVLPRLSAPKLVFLDAHFVGGADFGLSNYHWSAQQANSFPLLDELDAIKGFIGPNDVVVIDDARMYKPGGFQTGECPAFARKWEEGQKVEAKLAEWRDTHAFVLLQHDDGYFVLAPRKHRDSVSRWLNIRPQDAVSQQFHIRHGVQGVTSIGTQRRVHDSRFATRYFRGDGIDVGGGPDSLSQLREFFPLVRHLFAYDKNHGDGQTLDNVADESFDFLYSSYCLQRLVDPAAALSNWLRVVRPGGHLVIEMPDEDLYEQGQWPSRFNSEHRTTFTIGKHASWSPVSVNVLDLVRMFCDQAALISINLLDQGYRYGLAGKGFDQTKTPLAEAGIEVVLRKIVPGASDAKAAEDARSVAERPEVEERARPRVANS
jgi:hypothetical protein